MNQKREETITEAVGAEKRVVVIGRSDNLSTTRVVPYAELYHDQTALMETPIERLQKAAEEDRRRPD